MIDLDSALPDPANDRVCIQCRTCRGSGSEWIDTPGGETEVTCETCDGSCDEWVDEEEADQ